MTPGQAAYEVIRSKAITRFAAMGIAPESTGATIPLWDTMEPIIRAEWEEVAKAAIAAQDLSLHCEDHCICKSCL